MTKAGKELRNASIGLRLFQSVKDALERAAEADSRSVASLVEKIITQWLVENGHIKKRKS